MSIRNRKIITTFVSALILFLAVFFISSSLTKVQAIEEEQQAVQTKSGLHQIDVDKNENLKNLVDGKKTLLNVFYVEVNDTNILNVGTLTIGDTGIPFVDIAIIFAANINWDSEAGLPKLHFNPNVRAILEGHETYIKPLQEMGIKVVLDILPNHQGVGFTNLREQDRESFTDQLIEAIDLYGLDGIDFDEEYAQTGANGVRPQENSMSEMLYMLRQKMDATFEERKLITVFHFALPYDMLQGPRGSWLVENNVVDYAFGNYGSHSSAPYYVKGNDYYTGNSQEASHGIGNFNSQQTTTNNVMNSKMGIRMYFNIMNTVTNGDNYKNYAEALSGVTQALYGQDVVWNGYYYPQYWRQ